MSSNGIRMNSSGSNMGGICSIFLRSISCEDRTTNGAGNAVASEGNNGGNNDTKGKKKKPRISRGWNGERYE